MNCLKGVASFCSRGQKNEEEEQSLKSGEATGSGVTAPLPAAQASQKSDSKPADPAPKAASAPSTATAKQAAAPTDSVKKADPAPKAASASAATAKQAAAPADSVKKAESNGSQKVERRRAPDGRFYTRDEFLKFFGKKDGEQTWKWAPRK